MPAISFKYLPHIQWSWALLFPVMAPVIVFIGSWIYMRIYSAKAGLSPSTSAGLTLVGGMGNTSFLGFPMVAAFFAEKYIAIAVLCDQATFILLATAGISVAINASQAKNASAMLFVKKIISFPAFWSCSLAIILPHYINLSPLYPFFDKLAGTVAPLALFSIGLQLQFTGYRTKIKRISLTLLYKLMIAPAIVTLVAIAFHLNDTITKVTIFEMAMPPLISASIVAAEYDLDTEVTNLVIGIGLLAGIVTASCWWFILQLL
jgi:predicted permease